MKTKKEPPQYTKIIKVAEFSLAHKDNYERIAMALASAGYFVRLRNGDDAICKVVEVYVHF